MKFNAAVTSSRRRSRKVGRTERDFNVHGGGRTLFGSGSALVYSEIAHRI